MAFFTQKLKMPAVTEIHYTVINCNCGRSEDKEFFEQITIIRRSFTSTLVDAVSDTLFVTGYS